MQKEMTIHAALSYLKTADKRIMDALDNQFVTFAKIGADKIGGVSASTAKEAMKSSYQSITDIMNVVEAIKKAISKANAENTIIVCGKEMSVAEAIYMMQYGVHNKKVLLGRLRSQYEKAKASVDKYNGDDLEKRADKFIESIYGNKEKATGSEALAVREEFKKKNSYEIVDSIGILKEIQKLENWIAEFETEVDGAIQVSNATHTIIIDV